MATKRIYTASKSYKRFKLQLAMLQGFIPNWCNGKYSQHLKCAMARPSKIAIFPAIIIRDQISVLNKKPFSSVHSAKYKSAVDKKKNVLVHVLVQQNNS